MIIKFVQKLIFLISSRAHISIKIKNKQKTLFSLTQFIQYSNDDLNDDENNPIEDEAKWYEENNDIEKAIEIYYSSGKLAKSIELMGQNGMLDKIITTARRKLEPSQKSELLLCVEWITNLLGDKNPSKARSLCIEIYEKCNDFEKLINLLAADNEWAKAHVIAENTQNIDLINQTWLKHANYLAEHDEFNAAQKAFVQANQPLEATKVLSKLTKNAIAENRFLDASTYRVVLD